MKSIRDIPTPLLKSMRDLCPKKGGGIDSVEISVTSAGESPREGPKLTYETRQRINAELKRRRGG